MPPIGANRGEPLRRAWLIARCAQEIDREVVQDSRTGADQGAVASQEQGQTFMRDHHTDDQARGLLERQLANYLKTAACLTGVTRERVEMLAKLVREELAELDEAARQAALRRPAAGASWGPRSPWRLGDRPGFEGKTRRPASGDPVGGAGSSGPHPGRGRARGVA